MTARGAQGSDLSPCLSKIDFSSCIVLSTTVYKLCRKKFNPNMELIIRSRLNQNLILTLLLGLLTVFNLGCPGNGDDPRVDTTAPEIETVSPAEGSVDVSVSETVRVIFSELIDTNKITGATFVISTSVTGSFAFSGDTVTYNPATDLNWLTEYTVSVTTGVTDLAGNALANNKDWNFTTVGNPATTPPVVISTVPANLATNVDASTPISATFSKAIDSTTLIAASFSLSPEVDGILSYTDSTLIFIPGQSLLFNTQYTVTIDTSVADIFGNKLAAPYIWSFTIGDDPMIPTALIVSPSDRVIIGDTVTIGVFTMHPVAVTKVEFYLDGMHVSGADDLSSPFEFLWDASGETLASEHTISARAYEAGGRVGFSDTITLYYQWEELITDKTDLSWPTDLKRILARSSDTLLEFRYEFWESWGPDPVNDTTLDLGIYFDSDQSIGTGRSDFDGTPLNGLGADYRVIIGLHGFDAFARWNPNSSAWERVYDPSGFAYLNLPADTNILEFGMAWSDMGSPSALNMVSINLWFLSANSFLADWVPDQDSGYVTVHHENRYIGEGYIESSSRRQQGPHQAAATRENPF